MIPETRIPPRKQVRQFLTVIFLGIAAGILLVIFLVNYYGPLGRYKAKNVLLEPSTLDKLWYSDINPKTGGNSRFVLQGIEFVYRLSKNETRHLKLSQELYTKFYKSVFKDQSLLQAEEKVTSLFDSLETAQIIISVKTESNAEWQAVSRVFQTIQMVPDGDYYRIQLHEDNQGVHWAYFYHPQIFQETLKLFLSQP